MARVHPHMSTSHVVGYKVFEVSAKDLKEKEYLRDMSVTGIAVGKTGLEKLDKDIIGKVGFQRYEVNAYGKRIRQIQIDQGQPGENYKTTIDLEVQNFTSNLMKDVSGAAYVQWIFITAI